MIHGSLEADDSVVTSYLFPLLGTVKDSLYMRDTIRSQLYNIDFSSLLGVYTAIPGSYVDFGRNGIFRMCPALIDTTLSSRFPTIEQQMLSPQFGDA
jgi:hypothetical protein